MAVKLDERMKTTDIYADYPGEEVMYRLDHKTGLIFVKFYGKKEFQEPVEHSNLLFNDTLRFGNEITAEEYWKDRPALLVNKV